MPLIPAHITFRGLGHSASLEGEVNDRIAWLDRQCRPVIGCRVVVEVRHHHQHDGRVFHVRIDLTIAGLDPIVVDHESSLHGALKDVGEAAHHKQAETLSVQRNAVVAIHRAFDIARRHDARQARRVVIAAPVAVG